MHPVIIQPIINNIRDFFEDLPPNVIGILAGIFYLCLMLFCGVTVGLILSFFALFIAQSGVMFLAAFLIPFVLCALYGVYLCIKFIKIGYAKTKNISE